MISFEWDERKASANAKKHGVTFEEAMSIFYDDYAQQFFDEDHSGEEDRFLMLGMSNQARLLIVVHCVQESETVIRIVSARKATRSETDYYDGPAK